MSLKHLLVTLSGTALLAAGPVGTAVAAPGEDSDVRGPACADITDGKPFYSAAKELSVQLVLGAPACSHITYTTVVLDEASGAVLHTFTADQFGFDQADRPTASFAPVVVDDDDNAICIYSTTSAGRHVFDRAPDGTDCAPLSAGGPPPGFTYR